MVSDVDLLVVKEHAIDSLDGAISSFGRLIVNETVAFRTALFVRGDLARQDIAERRERVMKSLSQNY